MITFIVPTVNEKILNRDLKQSKIFKDEKYKFIFKENYPNVRKALNEGIKEANTKYICFVHEDVLMYDEFEQQLFSSLDLLTNEKDDIGVMGVAGVMWKKTNKMIYVGAVNDRGNKNWGNLKVSQNMPYAPVDTLDELLLIVPNEPWVKFDESQPSGHHLYGAELCFRAWDAGKQNYAIFAYCFHNAKWYKGNIVAELQKYSQYLKPQFGHHFPFATTCGIFK